MTMCKRIASAGIATLLLGATVIGGGKAAADVVFPDDVIVQGSLCAGLDCVNNENFGFATIRLKENNTRIDFTDTSVGTFPTRDWRLEANSSANGGANYFAIKDMGNNNSTGAEGGNALLTVTAGARANSIFVSSAGNVGFGTSTPVLVAHGRNGNTPGLRLEQDGSIGFPPYTWDVAGNEANFFIRDVTGGSRLPFRIRPGAPTSSIVIAASGNVGIGTASPGTKLDVSQLSGANGIAVRQRTDNPGSGTLFFESDTGTSSLRAVSGGNLLFSSGATIGTSSGTERMRIDSSGNVGIGTAAPATQLHTTGGVRFAGVANCGGGIQSNASGDLSCIVSSRQFKTIAGALQPNVALANVMALRPQTGAYRTTPAQPEHWLIAEDVAAVDPALVGYKDGKPYTVKTQNIVADLVAVIQQQQRRIEALEKLVAR